MLACDPVAKAMKAKRTAAKGTSTKGRAKPKPAPSTADTPKRRPGRPPKHGRATGAADDFDTRFPGARVIKRYGNRRLYDARLSRVTTLEEIADLVRRGEDVRVVDGDTGEDLTRRVLTQIILEEQNRRQLELLPVELLQRIIAARNDVAKEWIEQALSGLTRFITQSAQQVKSAAGAAVSMWPWAGFPIPGAPVAAPPPSGAPTTDGADDEAVRRELEELKRKMADLASRVGGGRRS
jgi:polyhydroxyalkanoate synthesis repressor PhaR